jgi:O-antigen/teichoic acid export membrane protein
MIVSSNQTLVPFIANLHEITPDRIGTIYKTSFKVLFYLALPLYALIIISLPAVSVLWIGRYEAIFVIFGILLSLGWFLNTLNAPAYFVYLGVGNFGWGVASHISIGVLNFLLGITFGFLFHEIGVVLAWAVSLALGSSMIYTAYHIKNKISLKEIMPERYKALILVCCFSVIIMYVFVLGHLSNVFGQTIVFAMCSSAILLFAWFNPIRKQFLLHAISLFREKS